MVLFEGFESHEGLLADYPVHDEAARALEGFDSALGTGTELAIDGEEVVAGRSQSPLEALDSRSSERGRSGATPCFSATSSACILATTTLAFASFARRSASPLVPPLILLGDADEVSAIGESVQVTARPEVDGGPCSPGACATSSGSASKSGQSAFCWRIQAVKAR